MTAAEAAPAKLNLFLNIVGRREDGYHLLDSLFAFVACVDHLMFEPANELSLQIEGPFAAGLDHEDNLVVSAARALAAEAGIAPHGRLVLEKQIPIAAGVGGGSADAAAALRLLNRAWRLSWPLERLMPLAARLGADVPACLPCQPVIARGIGDALTPAPALPPCGILLVNPRLPTPTPAVFRLFRELNPVIAPQKQAPMPDRLPDAAALTAAIAPRGNDLLPAALRVTPAIGNVLAALEALPSVVHAGFSGSGATCFALFATVTQAADAERHLAAKTDWWCWSGPWFDSAAAGITLP